MLLICNIRFTLHGRTRKCVELLLKLLLFILNAGNIIQNLPLSHSEFMTNVMFDKVVDEFKWTRLHEAFLKAVATQRLAVTCNVSLLA